MGTNNLTILETCHLRYSVGQQKNFRHIILRYFRFRRELKNNNFGGNNPLSKIESLKIEKEGGGPPSPGLFHLSKESLLPRGRNFAGRKVMDYILKAIPVSVTLFLLC